MFRIIKTSVCILLILKSFQIFWFNQRRVCNRTLHFLCFAARCGGTVTGPSGIIESIGYPTLPYSNNLFCQWRLQGLAGHYLTIHFEDFNLQNSSSCEKDFVEIWENHTAGQWKVAALFWNFHVHMYLFSIRSFFISKKDKIISTGCCEAQIHQCWAVPSILSLDTSILQGMPESPTVIL